MNKKHELRERWFQALESGKYKQGRGKLRQEGSEFCCLGVLCDIYDSSGWDIQAHHLGRNETPSNEVLWAVGLKHSFVNVLTHMNDREELSFRYIAGQLRARENEFFINEETVNDNTSK